MFKNVDSRLWVLSGAPCKPRIKPSKITQPQEVGGQAGKSQSGIEAMDSELEPGWIAQEPGAARRFLVLPGSCRLHITPSWHSPQGCQGCSRGWGPGQCVPWPISNTSITIIIIIIIFIIIIMIHHQHHCHHHHHHHHHHRHDHHQHHHHHHHHRHHHQHHHLHHHHRHHHHGGEGMGYMFILFSRYTVRWCCLLHLGNHFVCYIKILYAYIIYMCVYYICIYIYRYIYIYTQSPYISKDVVYMYIYLIPIHLKKRCSIYNIYICLCLFPLQNQMFLPAQPTPWKVLLELFVAPPSVAGIPCSDPREGVLCARWLSFEPLWEEELDRLTRDVPVAWRVGSTPGHFEILGKCHDWIQTTFSLVDAVKTWFPKNNRSKGC